MAKKVFESSMTLASGLTSLSWSFKSFKEIPDWVGCNWIMMLKRSSRWLHGYGIPFSLTSVICLWQSAENHISTWNSVATSFKPSLHDHSLIFDDDGRVYMLYGTNNLRLIELTSDASEIKQGGFNDVIIWETLSRLTVGPSGCPSSPNARFCWINFLL